MTWTVIAASVIMTWTVIAASVIMTWTVIAETCPGPGHDKRPHHVP
jgi:heme A synthase